MTLDRPDDAKLYFERDMSEVESSAMGPGLAAVYSAACPTRVAPNEDSAAVIPVDAQSCVLVVADGVGGSPGGEQASRIAVEALWSSLGQAARSGSPLRSAILDAIESANEAVTALGAGSATTLTVVEVSGGAVRPYHVGDSVVLVAGQRGRIKLQTVAHSPVGFAVEAGVIDEEEAMHHEHRHLVSNVLGARDMRVEVGSALELAPRDTVLLASDGLADNLHTDEIVERLRKGPLPDAVMSLAAAARRRMEAGTDGIPSKPDDLTCVAFRRTPGSGGS